jgi:hypothetical protein
MRKLLAKCWKDDWGALIATEYLFVATVLVIGTVVGLTASRNAVNAELTELSNAILGLSQSYVVSGQSGCAVAVDGTSVTDLPGTEPCPINTVPTVPAVLGCDTPCL